MEKRKRRKGRPDNIFSHILSDAWIWLAYCPKWGDSGNWKANMVGVATIYVFNFSF